ncbi:MAG: UDP-glucose 4-epimerase GalE, partial [Oscillospiraceae bacterium]
GAGYIGSHTCLALIDAGYDVIIVDNFVNSKPEVINRLEKLCGKKIPFIEADLCNFESVNRIFSNNKIESIIHFAGLKAVGESVSKPLEYYANNLGSTLNVLKCMKKYGIHNFVFSSSATVYGDPASVPIKEDFPLSVTNPYGRTKLMIEDILRDLYSADKSFNIALLRYFNPIGAHKSGTIGEDPFGIPNNLLPYVAQVAIGKLKEVSVFGNDYDTPDGTGVRDYIHVLDLADGHVAALKKLASNCGLVTYNLGTGKGYSVLDIIDAFSKACARDIPYKIVSRRPGDIAKCYADPEKASKELDWNAKYNIEDMCADSWRWQSMNPRGYDNH